MGEARIFSFKQLSKNTFGAVGGLVAALEVGGTINEEGEDKEDVGVLLRGSTAVDPKGEIPGKPGGFPPKPANREFGPPIFGKSLFCNEKQRSKNYHHYFHTYEILPKNSPILKEMVADWVDVPTVGSNGETEAKRVPPPPPCSEEALAHPPGFCHANTYYPTPAASWRGRSREDWGSLWE